MFLERIVLSSHLKTLALIVWLTFNATYASASEEAPNDLCENALIIEPNATARAAGSRCFQVYIEHSSDFWIDVSVPGTAEAEARLNFFGQACQEPRLHDPQVESIDRYTTDMYLRIRTSGDHLVCIAPQDPSLQLGEFKLTNALHSSFDRKSEDPKEEEPDPFSSCPRVSHKSEDPKEEEPDPLASCPQASIKRLDSELTFRQRSETLCRAGITDDHGDTFFCATQLEIGQAASGEIRNDWGDDSDVFAFQLSEVRTVEIATDGTADTFGVLFDRFGHRLAIKDNEGAGDPGFRLVKTLGPGWYFVRVEGRYRGEGTYRLHVDASSP